MSNRLPLATAIAAAGFLAGAPPSMAGPTVIRDEMLQDRAVTPSLGRGYSIATNTFQSICLTNIQTTKPSYNFNYRFEELYEDGSRSSDVRTSVGASAGAGYAGISIDVGGKSDSKTASTDEFSSFHILVTIDIDVYYSSVDEGRTKLSDSAAELLTSNDLPSFFDACGMYYLRSIGRKATYISIFSYRTKDSTRDTKFERGLKAEIQGWGQSVTASKERSETFASEASSRQLTIESHGFGLGKSESATLISYDLDTFRAAVKEAYKSTQPDDIGMVVSIEVAPWIENSEFQRSVKLVPQEVDDLDDNGNPILENGKPRKKKVLPYAQKRILNQNAEFLSELDRAVRARLNLYYKAKSCRARINQDFMRQKEDGTWAFADLVPGKPDKGTWRTREVVNNRNKERTTIGELYEKLDDEALARAWMEYDAFTYGGSGAPSGLEDPLERLKAARTATNMGTVKDGYPKDLFPGAVNCASALLEIGITAMPYRKIKECARVEEMFVVLGSQRVDDFCMPTLAPYKPPE
jgi:hypothetical protein